MTKFNTKYLGALPFSDTTVQIGLAATTALPYTIPGTSAQIYRAEFKWPYNASVWVGLNKTAILPIAATATASGNLEMNPDIRYVKGGDVLSFISDSLVTNASLSLLEIQN